MMSVDPAGRVDMPIVVDAFMTDGAVSAPAGWHVSPGRRSGLRL